MRTLLIVAALAALTATSARAELQRATVFVDGMC